MTKKTGSNRRSTGELRKCSGSGFVASDGMLDQSANAKIVLGDREGV